MFLVRTYASIAATAICKSLGCAVVDGLKISRKTASSRAQEAAARLEMRELAEVRLKNLMEEDVYQEEIQQQLAQYHDEEEAQHAQGQAQPQAEATSLVSILPIRWAQQQLAQYYPSSTTTGTQQRWAQRLRAQLSHCQAVDVERNYVNGRDYFLVEGPPVIQSRLFWRNHQLVGKTDKVFSHQMIWLNDMVRVISDWGKGSPLHAAEYTEGTVTEITDEGVRVDFGLFKRVHFFYFDPVQAHHHAKDKDHAIRHHVCNLYTVTVVDGLKTGYGPGGTGYGGGYGINGDLKRDTEALKRDTEAHLYQMWAKIYQKVHKQAHEPQTQSPQANLAFAQYIRRQIYNTRQYQKANLLPWAQQLAQKQLVFTGEEDTGSTGEEDIPDSVHYTAQHRLGTQCQAQNGRDYFLVKGPSVDFQVQGAWVVDFQVEGAFLLDSQQMIWRQSSRYVVDSHQMIWLNDTVRVIKGWGKLSPNHPAKDAKGRVIQITPEEKVVVDFGILQGGKQDFHFSEEAAEEAARQDGEFSSNHVARRRISNLAIIGNRQGQFFDPSRTLTIPITDN